MSRPRRAAAQAASTAIKSVQVAEAEIEIPAGGPTDTGEDAYGDVPNPGLKRGRKAAPDEFDDGLGAARTKKQRQMDLPSNTIMSPHIPQPAPFDRLPVELKRQILPYLDCDPYAILALQLTCKSWYLTMTTGRNTDLEWQRRCSLMGARVRSPGSGRYRSRSIAPAWVKVCEGCQFTGTHIFRCTMSLAGVDPADYDLLPHKFRKYDNRDWCKDYLKLSVDALIARRRQERLEVLEDVIVAYDGDQALLREAVLLVENKQSPSFELTKLVNILIKSEDEDWDAYDAVIEHYVVLKEVQEEVQTALIASELGQKGNEKWVLPAKQTYQGPQTSKESLTWLEAILSGLITSEDYIQFQLDRKFSLGKSHYNSFDRYREANQACGSRVVCRETPLDCEHGLCKFHHASTCDSWIHNLAAKVSGVADGETPESQLAAAKAVLSNLPGGPLAYYLDYIAQTAIDDQIKLRVLLDQASGVKDQIILLRNARCVVGIVDDTDWLIELSETFIGAQYYQSGTHTWLQAVSLNTISISDIVHYEVERKHFATDDGDEHLAFRTKWQACGAFVKCAATPAQCSHGRCEAHHFEECEELKRKEAEEKAAAKRKSKKGSKKGGNKESGKAKKRK